MTGSHRCIKLRNPMQDKYKENIARHICKAKILPCTIHKNQFEIDHRVKCKHSNYKTSKRKCRKNLYSKNFLNMIQRKAWNIKEKTINSTIS